MCGRLADEGHEVHLLTYGQGDDFCDARFEHHRIRRLPGDDAMRSGPTPVKPFLDALLAFSLNRLLATRPFDVVHCHNYEAAAVGLAVRIRRAVPVVYHSHNLMGDELPTYFRRPMAKTIAARFGLTLDAEIPRRADHTIALCCQSAQVLRERGVLDERISVVPPAVEDCSGLISAPAQSPGRARRFVVGYCGNLDRYQDLDLLARACANLAIRLDRDIELRLVTHGSDVEETARLRSLAAPSDLAVFRCRDFDDAVREMAACDVLTLPRRSGSGFPIKLLNYMCLGRPVVSNGCGSKALIDGVSGVIVPEGDWPAFARALASIASDPLAAARLGRGARARFEEKFTWDRVVASIEDVYSRTLRGCPETGRRTVLDGQG
jgi:glycosyltransferase involved in cell wall biosynthesis